MSYSTVEAQCLVAGETDPLLLTLELEKRRAYFSDGNSRKGLGFGIGDEVADAILGPAFVVGLPARDAPDTGEGGRGKVWLHFSSGEYAWRTVEWWSNQGSSVSAWKKAARIVFSMSANSAACERVFALLKNMYGEARDSSLSDALQAALMLRYNHRAVG